MKVYALNTLGVGVDTISLLDSEVPVQGVIGLSQRPASESISGYLYLDDFCSSHGFEFVEVSKYDLSGDKDKDRLLALEIDLLVVCGWQRLIPDWLINHCGVCAIGVHGSAYGITSGRGRSPQNWALLLGKEQFHLSIFAIDPGIDSGRIIDTTSFPITIFDDIRTCHQKVSWSAAEMISRSLKNGAVSRGQFQAQEAAPRYLPQRNPEDGQIDWSRSSREIYDFVRALARPYPGAFSFTNDSKVTIWSGRPFELDIAADASFGQIVHLFHGGDWLVKTGDGFFSVIDFTIEPSIELSRGAILSSASLRNQMRTIVQRHEGRYPDLPIANDILTMAGP